MTPADPEGAAASGPLASSSNPTSEAACGYEAGRKCYQLTHDYPVPSEREWLSRKQRETRRGRADDLAARYDWIGGNSLGKPHPVGTRRPNDWGLFDMHGNLWEWCQDRGDATGEFKDKEDIQDKEVRRLRGGAFLYIRAGNASSFGRYGTAAASCVRIPESQRP